MTEGSLKDFKERLNQEMLFLLAYVEKFKYVYVVKADGLFRLLIHPVLKKFVALSINFFKFLKF
jgi:hypothetical protein